MGESGSARFVIGSPLKGEFSIYIEYLSDRTDTVGCIWAATGSLIAGLHRHISILADSLSSSVGAYLCDPAFCFSSKAKTSGCPTHSFQKKTKEVIRLRLDKLIQLIQMGNDNKKDAYVSLIKKLALDEKIDFTTAKILISGYRDSLNRLDGEDTK